MLHTPYFVKKLGRCRGSARRASSFEILQTGAHNYTNYMYIEMLARVPSFLCCWCQLFEKSLSHYYVINAQIYTNDL